MGDDDVQAAAAKISWWEELADDDNRPGCLPAAVVLKNNYLAANPADDATAVDETWLRAKTASFTAPGSVAPAACRVIRCG